MGKRKVKIALQAGQGPPPGYQWSVSILDLAYGEAEDLLTSEQLEHVARQMRELASHADPTHSDTLSLDKVEDYYELRDKGGVFGRLNVRVFYGIDKTRRSIVGLGVIKKENDGPTPTGDKIRMRRRWRKYQDGEYGTA